MLLEDACLGVVASSKLMLEILADFIEAKLNHKVFFGSVDEFPGKDVRYQGCPIFIIESEVVIKETQAFSQFVDDNESIINICISGRNHISIIKKFIHKKHITFVSKYQGFNELSIAIAEASIGKRYISADLLIHGDAGNISELTELSENERKILELIYAGKSSREISDQLFLSVRTIENKRYQLMQKLGAKNVYEVIREAIHNGMLNPFM